MRQNDKIKVLPMDIFLEISLVIVIAAAIAGLMKLVKQPIVIGYIVAGLILGPQIFHVLRSSETFQIFSEMGIAILLFIVGLHLNPKEFAAFGKSASFIGLLQIALTGTFGFLISLFLGFNLVEAVYLATALSFSSTIVVLKLISDKKELEKLYARISIGVLLIQDIFAAIALIVASTFSNGSPKIAPFVILIIKGILLVTAVYLTGNYILPKLSKFFARSQEYLFLFSLAWGFGLASLFRYFGFSVEIGALIAGVALSVTPYSQEISTKLKPLRDFFVVLFFITLGAQISFDAIPKIAVPLGVFVLFVLFFKPLVFEILVGLFRYSRKTGFYTALSLAQISEFSIILAILGTKLGHIREETLTLLTIVAVISISVSAYYMAHLDRLYYLFSKHLKIFERTRIYKEKSIVFDYKVILFGCNRAGFDFINKFNPLGQEFLAVDFDPDIIEELEKKGINCCYGDAEDGDFLDEINIDKAEVIVSTIPDYDASLFLLTKVRKANPYSVVFLISYNIDEALEFYEKGASYVILPHFIGGEVVSKYAFEAQNNPLEIRNRRTNHFNYLKERKAQGHAHPVWGHNV